jgi:hypothetical protein
VVAPRWRLDARPELLPSPRDQGVVRKPAISGVRELYLSPVEFHEPAAGSLPNASVVAGVAVVDLSTKPFINLVWIGVLLAFLGTALAGIRRAAEKLPAPRGRPVASREPKTHHHTQTPRERSQTC